VVVRGWWSVVTAVTVEAAVMVFKVVMVLVKIGEKANGSDPNATIC